MRCLGGTVRAFATAVSAQIVTPSVAGSTVTFWRPIFSTTGRENRWTTSAVAASEASPPMGIPPSTTPAGTRGGVSAAAVAAAASATTSETRRARRFTDEKVTAGL